MGSSPAERTMYQNAAGTFRCLFYECGIGTLRSRSINISTIKSEALSKAGTAIPSLPAGIFCMRPFDRVLIFGASASIPSCHISPSPMNAVEKSFVHPSPLQQPSSMDGFRLELGGEKRGEIGPRSAGFQAPKVFPAPSMDGFGQEAREALSEVLMPPDSI